MADEPTRRGLTYAEALTALCADVTPCGSEHVALAASIGRALAAPVVSGIALPPWDNAGMDGYAVHRADVVRASPDTPVVLDVTGTIAAGADPAAMRPVTSGTAQRIMTGAPVPPGADAVIRVEDTDRGTERVAILDARDAAGRGNVRPRGEDVQPGDVLLPAGTTIGPSHLGAMASVGYDVCAVYRRPRVTILSSGDELVMLDRFEDVRAGRRIVASSSYALPALLRAAGADVTVAPLVPDTLDGMTAAVRDAVADGCDLLVTTGGVSVGALDYTRDALLAAGGSIDFWRARIRPGGPLGAGTVGGARWLGLPGNPVSTMVTATLFAWPLIRALGGHSVTGHRRVPVTMQDAIDTPATLTYFIRVALTERPDGALDAHLTGPQGSNLMRSMALADALLVVPEAVTRVEPGTAMQALLLP